MAASLLIAGAALAFTVTSFWWLNARRGHLEGYEPQVYAAHLSRDRLLLRLPLTLYNTGARSLTVIDLRAVIAEHERALPATGFRRSIRTNPEDFEDFPHPFPVAGRQAVSRFVDFERDENWSLPPKSRQRVRVDVRMGHDGKWSPVTTVDLVLPDGEKGRSFIAHRRDPSDGAPEISSWNEI